MHPLITFLSGRLILVIVVVAALAGEDLIEEVSQAIAPVHVVVMAIHLV